MTIRDAAAFAPDPGVVIAEPNGWAVRGLDANFFATARQQTRDGTVLGTAVTVRFTPVSFLWDYGDGTSRRTATPGTSWARSRIAEFDPTATSHRYSSDGDVSVRLTVSLRAEFRVAGGGWIPVDGTLDLPVPAVGMHVGTIETVLVDHPCAGTGRGGPGC
jgi:hypothetical protein